MDAEAKLRGLAEQMYLEPAEEVHPRGHSTALPCGLTEREKTRYASGLGISHAQLPNGKLLPMLKTMQTSACERNCYYCPFRAGRDYRRFTFKADELASTFMQIHRAGLAKGLFLSSGVVGGGPRTQDRILATAEVLRRKYGFRGYLHLKLMPGAEYDQVLAAMRLADRVSANLEAPNTTRLLALAPRKQFIDELVQPLRMAEQIRQTLPAHLGWQGRWASTATQFVVGGVGETDLELLSTTAQMYGQMRVKRTYFSAFSPVVDTPMEDLPPENPLRQHRLYQASFLMRDYDFDLESLPFGSDGHLPLNRDPKLAWAEDALRDTPVELNRAERRQLLQVPGIGPKTADRILKARRLGALRYLSDLRKLGLPAPERAAPFILLDGQRPPQQLALW